MAQAEPEQKAVSTDKLSVFGYRPAVLEGLTSLATLFTPKA
jgi:hypothetical protein